ncbi:class III lanthionine synthetase LanKC [Saccharopolyspora cebuensis]|uniref:non-specific serine/threonine protein kinase n=1 Tax=Saccharopolyspora cebuensis TaxID=418759 RepID=A0ABV4CI36_9PSEU
MDLRYEAFCFADPLFFDEQRKSAEPANGYSGSLPAPPTGWLDSTVGTWRMLRPEAADLPEQGWKIHVSATMDNARRVLSTVHEHCIREGLAFKHLHGPEVLLARNAKYAPRSASGKLITIYPPDEQVLSDTLSALDDALSGQPGPYILSDLRYGSGPLYVRYGGFAERWTEFEGTRVLAITGPDGALVPDHRGPSFVVPDWVALPDCLAPHLAARKSGDPAAFPYRVTGSLHFSNGGGVYRAVREADQREVVLKEARPHAGLDRDGTDAVARLRREHDVLRRLDGVPGVPAAHDLFPVWEHTFLAMEEVPGTSLGSWLARNYPLTRLDPTEADVADYTERALALLDRVAAVVDGIHARGVMFGDLHALNVLVDDDGSVSLIDFEMAAAGTDAARPALGAPGFRAPDGRTGPAVDRYALAALRLWLFLPVTPLLELCPGRLPVLVDAVERRFPLPAGFGDELRRELLPRGVGPARTELDRPRPDWDAVRDGLAEAIAASATPEREDRLHPGDIEQFRTGGTTFAHGAAGVLHALDVAGRGRFPEHERWLVDAVRRAPVTRPGFLDGAHGTAHVLENFGHHDDADALLDAARPLLAQTRDHGYGGGLAGMALNLLHFAGTRRDREYAERARDLGDRLADALRVAAPPGDVGRAGLVDGWAGPALLFTRLHDDTGDRGWLELADRALLRDLDECTTTDDGTAQVRDGGARTLPYVAVGSAGIALVAEELALRHPAAACLSRQADLLRACTGEFVIHPGLLHGRCGLLAALAAADRRAPDPELKAAVDRHLSALAWHAIPWGERGIAMPGNQLLRLSMDLGTGGAGVLATVAATLDGHGRVLPFFGAAPAWTSPEPGRTAAGR